MKKRGFTLIELLGVIVILSIISLIAVPVFFNIINGTKDSSILVSAEHYLNAVNLNIVNKKVLNNTNSKICSVQKNGNLLCEGYQEEIKIEMEGQKPTGGTIEFLNGKINNVLNLRYDKEIISKIDGTLQKVTKETVYDTLIDLTGTIWRFKEDIDWSDLGSVELVENSHEQDWGYGNIYIDFVTKVKFLRSPTEEEASQYAYYMAYDAAGETTGEVFESAYVEAKQYLLSLTPDDEGYIKANKIMVADGEKGADFSYYINEYNDLGKLFFNVREEFNGDLVCWLKLPSELTGYYGDLLDKSTADINIYGGQDVTNVAFINWLKEKAEFIGFVD